MPESLFTNFDFKVLDDPHYKEDAVREDIVAPILRKLGYSPTGENKMLRSVPLVHPFVQIGTKKHKVNIIPDYLLQINDRCVFTLDAKAPTEDIKKGGNVEQAYSYAIHRDVRAFLYGLCNGREITIFQITRYEPILSIPVSEIDQRWNELYKTISPLAFTKPHLLEFQPDFGLSMLRYGTDPKTEFHFVGAWISIIIRISDELYSLVSTISYGEDKFAASFDFPKTMFEEFLKCVPLRIRDGVKEGLSRQPYNVSFNEKSTFQLIIASHLGDTVISNGDEDYLPLIVDRFEPLPDVTQIVHDITKGFPQK